MPRVGYGSQHVMLGRAFARYLLPELRLPYYLLVNKVNPEITLIREKIEMEILQMMLDQALRKRGHERMTQGQKINAETRVIRRYQRRKCLNVCEQGKVGPE